VATGETRAAGASSTLRSSFERWLGCSNLREFVQPLDVVFVIGCSQLIPQQGVRHTPHLGRPVIYCATETGSPLLAPLAAPTVSALTIACS
jgi:hypothetical protein